LILVVLFLRNVFLQRQLKKKLGRSLYEPKSLKEQHLNFMNVLLCYALTDNNLFAYAKIIVAHYVGYSLGYE
jgi:hypothetical protein